MGRQDVGIVFDAADRLADAGQFSDADRYYLDGLRIEPHDFDHHLRYAQTLAREGKQTEEMIQAEIILNGCEDLSLVEKAMALTGDSPMQITPFENQRASGVTLVLVPLGDVDLMLLQQEQKRLHEDLGIDVQIHSLAVKLREPARNLLHPYADKLRQHWQQVQGQDSDAFSKMLGFAGMSEQDLSDDAKAVQFTISVLQANGQERNAMVVKTSAAQLGDQWSCEDMLSDFSAAIPTPTSPKVRFIGFTSNDIFMKDTNYVFAEWKTGGCAIVSYHRFTANFNSEIPSRVRLLRRLHCLCLGDVGHIFGLDRSTDPMCPLCYVDSLPELDLKADKLCDESRHEFDLAFAAAATAPDPAPGP
jgi:predicted Zn-dependent protease